MTICDGRDGIFYSGTGSENTVTIVTTVTHGKGWNIKDMKNVQISQDLFFAIMKYFLFEEEELLPEIQKGLEQKLDALVMRELYTKYKTAPTEEEKQEARKKYLDKRGVPDSFRW